MLGRIARCLTLVLALLTACNDDGRDYIRFAVIADYGRGSEGEASVAELVRSKDPDFIITAGDNNYTTGSAETIDENIGKFFHDYIYPYRGYYGPGSEYNRFYPSPGNHDLMENNGQAYYDYFTLPNNERYYDFVEGPVHFFAMNSDPNEVDGTTVGSAQEQWLRQRIATSTSSWRIVYFHHSPYSSAAVHGSNVWMQWDFGAMGVAAVFSGHDHVYERIHVGTVVYVIAGICDDFLYEFALPVAGSQVRYNEMQGAVMVRADDRSLVISCHNVGGELVDEHVIAK
jgi:hypothetical protein